MSYSNSSTNSLRSPVAPGDSAGFDRFIDQQVAKTGAQVKFVDICSSLMVFGAGVLSFLLIVTVLDHWVASLGIAGRWTALALLACAGGWYLIRVVLPVLFGRVNPLFAARTIEHSEPSLKNSLINFLLFRSDRAGVRAGVYQALEQRAAADLSHVPVDTAVDRSRLIRIGYVLAGVLAVCAAYTILAPKSPFQSVARILAPWADIERPSRVRIEDVQPGNVEVFQGERIAVSADCYDLRRDEPVTVHFTALDEQLGRQSAMMQPVAGNLRHECRLPPDDEGFQRDVMYWIEAGDARTPSYRVRVVPAPVILVESIEYEYPAYTKLPKRVVERQGDIKAVEGTRITVRAHANQPILAAVLEFDPPAQDADPNPATAASSTSGPLATSAYRIEMEFREQEAWCSFVCELDEQRQDPKHRTYQLRFSTQGGHRNPQPVLHRLEVLRDLPPEVEILTPVQDRVEVPEDGWQKIEVRAVDPDFGLTAIRLEAVAGGRQVLKRDLLLDPAGRNGQEIASFDFAPRACGMRAGTEAKCWAMAEDNRTSPKTGSPEPNVVKSRELTLVVTRSAAAIPPDQGAAEKQEPAGKPSPDRPKDGAGDKPPPGGQASQDSHASQPPSSSPENSDSSQGQQDQANAPKQPSGGGEGSSGSGQQGGESNQTSQSGGTGGNADSADSSASQSGGDSPPEGGNMPGDGNSDGTSGTDGSQGGAGSSSSQPGAGGSQGGSTGGSDSSGGSEGGEGSAGQSAEPLHDGEAFEKTMQHMQQTAEGQGKEGGSSGGADTQAADQGGQKSADAQSQVAAQQGASSGSGKPSKSEPSGQPQPAAGAGQTGGRNEPQSPKPEDAPAGASGQQQGAAKPSPGQQPEDKSPGGAQPPQGSSGSEAKPQGSTEQQGGAPKPSQSGSGQQKEPGQSDGGQSGSGQPNENRGGSASGQNPEGTSQKQPSSGGGEPRPSQEPQAPSMSKKAGGAQGDAGGDQSGGGKQGGGQGGQQPGNDKPGGTSPGDQGAGAAQESGQGDLAQRPGDKQESQERTGASGYDPGTGTKSKPAAEGAAGSGAQGESAQGGPSPSVPKTPADGAPSERGQGLPLGGGAPSSAELQGTDMGGEVPAGEQPNIEYARKATDMVLEYLKDQQSNPDEDLLKKLGWTKEDLQDFARRWADLKRAANEDPRAKQQLDDALRSLGLRPVARDPRRSDVQQDTRRTERNLGDRSRPPSAYSELFDAYRKGTGRVGER